MYYNLDPANIRNIAEYGGGAVMDIGCYPINVARWFFGGEPDTVSAAVRRDPVFKTDVLTSAVLDFGGRQATFTCATQLEPTSASTSSAPPVASRSRSPSTSRRTCRPASSSLPAVTPVAPDLTVFELPPCDQYTVQGDAFARAVREGTPVPTPPEDASATCASSSRSSPRLRPSPGRPPCPTARRFWATAANRWPVQGGRTGGR